MYIYSAILYYTHFALNKEEIGVLQALNPLVSLVSIPCIMYLVETWKGSLKTTMIVCTAVGAILYASTAWVEPNTASTLPLLVTICILTASTLSSLGSILDSITLQVLGDRKELYGQQRLFGSFSWGLGSLLTGWLIEKTGNPLFIVYSYLFFILFFLATASFIPTLTRQKETTPQHLAAEPDCPEISAVAQPAGSGDLSSPASIPSVSETTRLLASDAPPQFTSIWQSMAHPKIILFFLSTALTGLVFSVLASYVFLYFSITWNLSPTLLGITTPLSILWELPIFYFSGWFLKNLGSARMIVLSHVLLLIRLALYCVMPLALAPWMDQGARYLILLVEILHGAAFGLSWAAGMEFVQSIAPPRFQSTYVGLYSSCYNNLGGIVGNLIGGWIYQEYGYISLFCATGAIVGLSLMFFLASLRVSLATC
ncbi:hypothetical protein HDV03_002205 [Kappamyces sp. JEL0829]|nr:hypothetical protein HDV03_002205 [Kappamyces sp. JEL0829]